MLQPDFRKERSSQSSWLAPQDVRASTVCRYLHHLLLAMIRQGSMAPPASRHPLPQLSACEANETCSQAKGR